MKFLVRSFAIILAWTLVKSNNQRDKLFFFEKDNETLLVVTWTEDEISSGCEIFRDKNLIAHVIASSKDSPIRSLSADELPTLLQGCTEFVLRRKRSETDEDNEEDSDTNLLENVINGPSELAINGQQNRQQTRNRQQNQQQTRKRQQNQPKTRNRQQNQPQTRNRQQQNGRGSRTGNNNGRRTRTSTTTSSSALESTTKSPEAATKESTATANDSTTIQTTTYPTTTLGYDGLPVIYPGTKWCGAGALAKSYGDLGTYQDTDKCCRAHDLCNETLAPGESKYNLTNDSMFTKLSCRCDDEFYYCLSKVNSFTSNSIGNLYFNVLRRDCYKREYPLTKKCKSYLTLLKITCMEYERDRNAPKVYQWIPAKRYKNIPVPG